MTTESGYPGLKPNATPPETARVVNRINQGKVNNAGTVTLATSASSTRVSWPTIGPNDQPVLFPRSSTAAVEATTTYLLSVSAEVGFVVAHSVTATATRTYSFIIGGKA